MERLIDDFILLNQSGRILNLCQKYYDEKVLMLNNGAVFAESMQEAYEKQKGFIETIKEFDIELVSKDIRGNIAELTFHYKMTTAELKIIEFKGKHLQTWKGQKIIREEYETVTES